MQNYEQIMQELEIEVPEDKKDALKKKCLRITVLLPITTSR